MRLILIVRLSEHERKDTQKHAVSWDDIVT